MSYIWDFTINSLVQLLAPFAPHVSDELWQLLGHDTSIHESSWPVHDDKYLQKANTAIVIQVNGKLRAQFEVSVDALEADIVEQAKSHPKVVPYLEQSKIKKIIYVPNRLVNFVI